MQHKSGFYHALSTQRHHHCFILQFQDSQVRVRVVNGTVTLSLCVNRLCTAHHFEWETFSKVNFSWPLSSMKYHDVFEVSIGFFLLCTCIWLVHSFLSMCMLVKGFELFLSLFLASLYLKEEAYDFVEQDTLKNLIKKYSQFINFPIYLWASKVRKNDYPGLELGHVVSIISQ